MNEKERQDFVYKEIEAIYEEFDNLINHLCLSRRFLQKIIEVSKGAEPDYDNFVKIINRVKK